MLVQTKIQGGFDISTGEIITMVKPIFGFENLDRFCLIDTLELEPFALLQSIDDPDTAFLIVDPRVFIPDYNITVSEKDVEEMSLSENDNIGIYAIVTLDKKTENTTLNLSGPIIINHQNNCAKQLVMTDTRYDVRYRLFDEVTEKTSETVLDEVFEDEPVML